MTSQTSYWRTLYDSCMVWPKTQNSYAREHTLQSAASLYNVSIHPCCRKSTVCKSCLQRTASNEAGKLHVTHESASLPGTAWTRMATATQTAEQIEHPRMLKEKKYAVVDTQRKQFLYQFTVIQSVVRQRAHTHYVFCEFCDIRGMCWQWWCSVRLCLCVHSVHYPHKTQKRDITCQR